MNKLDELFKRKTSAFKKKPSEDAWQKIHQNLRPRPVIKTWHYAALIALLIGVSAILHNQMTGLYQQTNPEVAAENNVQGTEPMAETEKPMAIRQELSKSGNDTVTNTSKVEEDGTNKPADPNSNPVTAIARQEPSPENNTMAALKPRNINPDTAIIKPVEESRMIAATVATPLTPVETAEEELPAVTIVYKKSGTALASAENEKNNKGLLKVLDFAKELKKGEVSLAEIRQAKDDLLAIDINFIKNNKRSRD